MTKRETLGMAIRHWPTFLNGVRKHNKLMKKNAMLEEKYMLLSSILEKLHKFSKVNINTYGMENLADKRPGSLFMGNHQGQADGPVIFTALKDHPTSCLMNKTIKDNLFFQYVINLVEAELLDTTNLRSQLATYNNMVSNMNDGKSYIIFPEGKHDNNKNELLEFNTGCLTVAYKSKATIYPFCLYDAWKLYNTSYNGKDLNAECHFLTPIYYDEYKDLSKKELCDLLKNRIQNKLNEIKREKGEML